jgi:hypothetical protein
MRILIVIVQLLVALFLTASLMPLVLVSVPAAQNDRVGLGIMIGLLAVAFTIVSLMWPARKQRP